MPYNLPDHFHILQDRDTELLCLVNGIYVWGWFNENSELGWVRYREPRNINDYNFHEISDDDIEMMTDMMELDRAFPEINRQLEFDIEINEIVNNIGGSK